VLNKVSYWRDSSAWFVLGFRMFRACSLYNFTLTRHSANFMRHVPLLYQLLSSHDTVSYCSCIIIILFSPRNTFVKLAWFCILSACAVSRSGIYFRWYCSHLTTSHGRHVHITDVTSLKLRELEGRRRWHDIHTEFHVEVSLWNVRWANTHGRIAVGLKMTCLP
jgi:hypothetical protein